MSARRILHLDDVARGLGWFSVALGMAEMLAPGQLAHDLGLRRKRRLLRLYGLRETAAGLGLLLSSRNRGLWLLARAGGDVLDISTLRRASNRRNRQRDVVRGALVSVLAITAVDILGGVLMCLEQNPRMPVRDYSDRKGIRAETQSPRLASSRAQRSARGGSRRPASETERTAPNRTGQTP